MELQVVVMARLSSSLYLCCIATVFSRHISAAPALPATSAAGHILWQSGLARDMTSPELSCRPEPHQGLQRPASFRWHSENPRRSLFRVYPRNMLGCARREARRALLRWIGTLQPALTVSRAGPGGRQLRRLADSDQRF